MNEVVDATQRTWIGTVLDQFEGPLIGYAVRITGDADLARDVVQETFLRLCGESPADLNGCLGPWLFTVCRNRAFDVRKKERRLTAVCDAGLDVTAEAPGADPSAAAERRESSGRIVRLLAALPENQQEVIHLRFQGALSYKEIAAVTGLSVTNVGYLIHTAIAALREKTKD